MTRCIKILTENQANVISRLTTIFTRFGVEIERLVVKAIKDSKCFFIKVSIICDEPVFNLLKSQVEKQVQVISVRV